MKINRKSKEMFFKDLKYGDVFYYTKDRTALFLKGYNEDDCDCQINLDDGFVESPNLAEKVVPVDGSFIEGE